MFHPPPLSKIPQGYFLKINIPVILVFNKTIQKFYKYYDFKLNLFSLVIIWQYKIKESKFSFFKS